MWVLPNSDSKSNNSALFRQTESFSVSSHHASGWLTHTYSVKGWVVSCAAADSNVRGSQFSSSIAGMAM